MEGRLHAAVVAQNCAQAPFFFSHSIIDVASVGQLKELVCNLKPWLQL